MPLDLDHPALRRRALAARAVTLADSLQLARDGGRALGVPCPARVTPAGLRRWARRLEAANATSRITR